MKFAVAVRLHTAADDGAVEHAERSEQGGRAVPLVIVCHRLTTPRLDRQPRLGAVERLDLALFVEREHHSVGRWIDVKPDNIGQLGSKARIARPLEGADAVGLQLVRLPDALYRAQRDADRFGHGPASPMGCLVRRRGAGQRHHLCRGWRGNRRFAGLAGLVAQQPFNPNFGVALLPAPYCRPADTDARRDPLRRFPRGRGENDARPFDMLPRLVAVTANRLQPFPIGWR